MGQVVDNLNAVNSTVINLVLDRLQKIVIANWVVTGAWRRPSYKQNASFPIYIVWEIGVLGEPRFSRNVPIVDFGTQGVGFVGIDGGFQVFIIWVILGSDFGYDSIGFFYEVGSGGSGGDGGEEVVEANGAVEDEDGDEGTEDSDPKVGEEALAGSGGAAFRGGGGGEGGGSGGGRKSL